jgi:HEAT repeat protein
MKVIQCCPCVNATYGCAARLLVFLVIFLPCLTWADSAQDERIASLIKQYGSQDWKVRRNAVSALGEIAPGANKALLVLIEALKDEDSRVRRSAAEALGGAGPMAARATRRLTEMLKDEDSSVRQAAASALGRIGRKARKSVSPLTGLLKDKDPRIRASAAQALGGIGPRAADAVPAIRALVKDREAQVRASAARALARISPGAEATVPTLNKLLSDRDANVRDTAAHALGEVGRPAVPVLINGLKSGNPIFLQAVTNALGRIGAPAVPALIKTLSNPDEKVLARQYAAVALTKINDNTKEIVSALTQRLDDDNSVIRRSAAGALGKIGPAASAAVPRLIDLSRDESEDSSVREYAVRALTSIDPKNEKVASTLISVLEDESPRVREAAVEALLEVSLATPVSGAAKHDVPTLITQLKDTNPRVRWSAARGLAEVGPAARSAGDALSQVLADEREDIEVRKAAAAALGSIGSYAKQSIAALINILEKKGENPELRAAAAVALGMIGPDARAAVPVLVESLKDSNARLRAIVLVTLKRIGPHPKTIPTLAEAMRDNDLEARGSAALAIQNFVKSRSQQWQPLLSQSEAPVLRIWLARHGELYGVRGLEKISPHQANETRTTDIVGVLGGRAAVRETLQLQLIDTPTGGHREARTIPISKIDAVDVKSHPFDKMLQESRQAGRRLPLAELVPSDHFFAYFTSLSALQRLLEGGGDFLFRLNSAASANNIDYNLRSRYLERLGLTPSVLLTLLATGAVSEIAVMMPDLFFVDGTDITVIVRVSGMSLVRSVLTLDDTPVMTRQLPSGQRAYWATRDNILLLSTSRQELEKVLHLHQRAGRGSLGQSAEFQYMLQQLPLAKRSQAYLYFSDPFIRHLVDPATKIAQLRRMQAKADLEMVTAGALLYKLDGHYGTPTMSGLLKLGYVPRAFSQQDYKLRRDLVAESKEFGTIADLRPLSKTPVNLVSQSEAQAYKTYVANYSRYWRQFFDPIAVRLDDLGGGSWELTTFILPLLDSAIYSRMGEAIRKKGDGGRLKIPELSPEPTLVLSLNVSDSQRIELTKELTSALIQYTSVSPAILDSVGSAVHFAIMDSEPIVALGSGDIFGAFSEEMLRLEGFPALTPVLLSILTRPCKLLVELSDPARVLNFLRQAGLYRARGGGQGELYQVAGKDAWIYKLTLFDVIQLHLRVAVQNGYLVITNIPWSQRTTVKDAVEAPLNGASLEVNMETVSRQLPALYAKTYSDYRSVAVEGMGYLYPLLASGVATNVADAQKKHQMLFGFTPVHPAYGQWLWENGEIRSSTFGTASRPIQPEFRPGDRDFGIFPDLDSMSVNMQLEDTGLRAHLRWKLTAQ